MAEEVVLKEASPPQAVPLDLGRLLALQRLGVCDLVPGAGDEWLVARVRRVGVVRIDGVQVRINPKLPVPQLLVLLGFDDGSVTWRPDDPSAEDGAPITDALARAFTRVLAVATEQGLLRAYRETEESGQVVRGRWDIIRQVSARQGALLPVELIVDEFDVDTPPNRILLAAAVQLLRMEGVSPSAARRLRSLVPRFEGVTMLRPGAPLPPWHPARRDVRLRPAVRMARLILAREGVTNVAGSHSGVGFLVTMSSLFEDFVERTLTLAAVGSDLQIRLQHKSWLDSERSVLIKPDVLVTRGDRALAVIDAKYKVEQTTGYPNADVYQAIVYAQRHRLQHAHLLYAKGEVEEQRIAVPSSGVVVHRWAVDLEASRSGMLSQMKRILATMIAQPEAA